MNKDKQVNCWRHFFVTKGKAGVPGTMWQECELCGQTPEYLLTQSRIDEAKIHLEFNNKVGGKNISEVLRKLDKLKLRRIKSLEKTLEKD